MRVRDSGCMTAVSPEQRRIAVGKTKVPEPVGQSPKRPRSPSQEGSAVRNNASGCRGYAVWMPNDRRAFTARWHVLFHGENRTLCAGVWRTHRRATLGTILREAQQRWPFNSAAIAVLPGLDRTSVGVVRRKNAMKWACKRSSMIFRWTATAT